MDNVLGFLVFLVHLLGASAAVHISHKMKMSKLRRITLGFICVVMAGFVATAIQIHGSQFLGPGQQFDVLDQMLFGSIGMNVGLWGTFFLKFRAFQKSEQERIQRKADDRLLQAEFNKK